MGKSQVRLDKGAVLIVLLWVLTALSLIALSLGREVGVEVAATRNSKTTLQEYYLAKAGMANTIYKLMKRREPRQTGTAGLPSDQEPTDVDLGLVTTEFDNGRAICEIEDESGKININNQGNEPLLRSLMTNIGIDKEQADIIVDSTLDWIDADNLRRLNGAENEYYQSLPIPYQPKNSFLEVLEEMLLVRGVTPEIFYGKRVKQDNEVVELYGLVKYLTVYSNSFQINVNSAPIPVLMSLPGIDAKTARLIYEARKIRPFKNAQEISERLPVLPIGGPASSRINVFSSNTYSIKAIGQLNKSLSKRVLRAVVRVPDPTEKLGYKVLYWNENANY